MIGFKEFFNNVPRRATENEIVYMYSNGMEIDELEKEGGRTRGDIYRILKRNQVAPSRLNKKKNLVDYFHSAGYSPKAIAKEVGMTPQGVRYSLKRNIRD